jgi:splicing factor 45
MHSTTSTTSITAKKKTSGLVAFAFTPVSVIRKTGIGSNSSTSTVITDAKKAQVLGSEEGTSASAEVGDVFVQAVYRDEYDPSRPNSYEVFCHERKTKEKMKQVKKDIEKRQRKQDEKVSRSKQIQHHIFMNLYYP